jgi:hypothetical protein
VAGAQRRQPPLPPFRAPDAGATQSPVTNALPLPTPSPTTSTTVAATVAEEVSSGRHRHDTWPASNAELRRRLCTPQHIVDLDRLPIEPRGLLRIGGGDPALHRWRGSPITTQGSPGPDAKAAPAWPAAEVRSQVGSEARHWGAVELES